MANEVFIDKREGERIRLGLNEFQGKEYVDIRQFYQVEDGEWRPTKKGVTLPTDKWPEFRDAVGKLAVPR